MGPHTNMPLNEVFRAVTGGAYNFPSSTYGIPATGSSFPAKGSIPVAQPKAGTIISTGKNVRGTGTSFLVDVYVGDFIYTKEVLRRVKAVISDTLLVLDQAFPTDVTVAVQLLISRGGFNPLLIRNAHASATSLVNSATLAAGGSLEVNAPISYDATGSTLEFTAQT